MLHLAMRQWYCEIDPDYPPRIRRLMDGVVHIQNMFPTYQSKIFIWMLCCTHWIGGRVHSLQQAMDFQWNMGLFFPWNQSVDDVAIFSVCPCCATKHKSGAALISHSRTWLNGSFPPKVVDGHADQHSKASHILGQCTCWFLHSTIWRSSNEAPDVLPRTSLGR